MIKRKEFENGAVEEVLQGDEIINSIPTKEDLDIDITTATQAQKIDFICKALKRLVR